MSPIVAQSIFFLKDFGQKVLQTWILRMREELVRLGLFQDLTLIHEEDTRGYLAGKFISCVTTTMVIPSCASSFMT